MAQSAIGGQVIVGAVITVGLFVLGAFWFLADPRGDIKQIEANLTSNYMTLREHRDYKERIDSELNIIRGSITNHANRDSDTFLTRGDFERWMKQREILDHKQNEDINRLENTRPTTGELNAQSSALMQRIGRLEEQVQKLMEWRKNHDPPPAH